jgi:signal peptidase I
MEPTLASGDWVLLDRHAYRHQPPQRGDIVVARVGRERLIKRIVGLPGETVEIRKGRLFVNDQPAPEPHSILSGPLDIAKGQLRPDHYALLGDNRTVSDLLPLHLIVHRDQVLGKVIAVLPLGTFFKSAPRHEPAPPSTHVAAT